MHHPAIRFQGSYRYPSPAILEAALAAARRWLDEGELDDLDGDWLGSCARAGAVLRIDTLLPVEACRFAAVAVLEALAQHAVEGLVEARRGGVRLDAFPCGTDD